MHRKKRYYAEQYNLYGREISNIAREIKKVKRQVRNSTRGAEIQYLESQIAGHAEQQKKWGDAVINATRAIEASGLVWKFERWYEEKYPQTSARINTESRRCYALGPSSLQYSMSFV